jgi:hypothetical protein
VIISPAVSPAQWEVRCCTDPFDDLLPTGALGLLIAFSQRIGFFDWFDQHFHPSIQSVVYSPIQKLQTLIWFLAVGCDWIKDIHHKLRPYRLAAQWLGMQRFPDPSSINRFLNALDSPQRQQLELISEQLLQRFGLYHQTERVDLDIDSTGWMVYGCQLDGGRKGYFPRQRGRRGYRLTIVATGHPAGSEILSVCLDPAHIAANGRFWDCFYQAVEVLGSFDRLGLILADAACGSGPDVQELIALGPSFLVKGISDKTANKFASRVDPTQRSLSICSPVFVN